MVGLFLLVTTFAVTGLYSHTVQAATFSQKSQNDFFSFRQKPNAELETQNPVPVCNALLTVKLSPGTTGTGEETTVIAASTLLYSLKTVYPPAYPSAYLQHIYPTHNFW